MKTTNIPLWIWLRKRAAGQTRSVPVSSDHRWLWGWMRLLIGLTQMGFALAAAYLLIESGLNWRSAIAASMCTVATVASRYLFAGRPDPRLEASLMGEPSRRHRGKTKSRSKE